MPQSAATMPRPFSFLLVHLLAGVSYLAFIPSRIAAAALPILVEDMTFSGLLRVKIKLMTNFPHVQVVDLSFMEKPVIDYVLKPIGGETLGFDIANVSVFVA